jgi:hypothetical protein
MGGAVEKFSVILSQIEEWVLVEKFSLCMKNVFPL